MSECDQDELIATRKLNGLEDNLYKKSDKNVVNMTEEAFNELIDNFEVVAHLTMYGRKGIKDNVKKLQSRIKELEESNRIYALNGSNIKLELYIKENYIPVQKVKETVKEVIELIESEQFKIIMGDMTKVGRIKYLLEKLLEEK